MAKDSEGRDITKHTLNLFTGDYDRLNDLFPQVKAAKVIRHLVRDLIKRTEGAKPDVQIELPDNDGIGGGGTSPHSTD